jgi:Fe-S oxidoreductase
MSMLDIFAMNKDTGVLSCLECGKCTSVCPVSRIGGSFSPRSMMSNIVEGDYENVTADPRVWECLTCGQCQPRCPHNIDFSVYCRKLRGEAIKVGNAGSPSHDGALHQIMELMASRDLKQKRMEWIPKKAKVAEKGDILYFVGCQPYYDAYFDHLKLNLTRIGVSVLTLLNRMGIEPVVMAEERCCGHDLIWSGREKEFLDLAKLNVEAIRKTGAKKILFSCAECYRTLAKEYAEYLEPLDMEMQHMSEFLAEQIGLGNLSFKENESTLTYHDPCRLSRQMGVIEEPRTVLKALAGDHFKEMGRHGKSSVCCGTSSWMNCNMTSKKIQSARLKEAGGTGARTLVTACPKCLIHFECTKTDETLPDACRVEIKDLCTAAAEAQVSAKESAAV